MRLTLKFGKINRVLYVEKLTVSQMEINRRRFYGRVPEKFLHVVYVYARFDEVRRKAVTQRMDSHILYDSCLLFGNIEYMFNCPCAYRFGSVVSAE